MTIIDKIIKKVEDDKRLEQDTRNDISEKLKNISSIDGYLGQIVIYWEIEQPQDTTVFGPFNPTPLLLAIELSYIDIAIVVPLLYAIVKGFSNGVIKEITGLLGFVFGIFDRSF